MLLSLWEINYWTHAYCTEFYLYLRFFFKQFVSHGYAVSIQYYFALAKKNTAIRFVYYCKLNLLIIFRIGIENVGYKMKTFIILYEIPLWSTVHRDKWEFRRVYCIFC